MSQEAPSRMGASLFDGTWPTVSVVVPVFNATRTIDACLDSLHRQDYPLDRLEIVVADGFSTDGSTEKVLERAATHAHPRVTIVANPKRSTASGLNVGIAVASGDVIVRLDAHSEAPSDYIRCNVEVLAESGADYVGGRPMNQGTGYWGEAIALAMASRFGVGAHFRTSNKACDTDTVAFGAFLRTTFEKVGPFDETLIYSEDNEYTYRIRARGGRVHYDPKIHCTYHPRRTIIELFRQYQGYGWGRMRHALRDGGGFSLRHLVPMIFVGTLFVLYADAPVSRIARHGLAGLLAAYALATAVASVVVALASNLRYLPALPIVFLCLHTSYGIGQWHAVASRVFGRDRGWKRAP